MTQADNTPKVEAPPYFSLSFQGRFGRLHFINSFLIYLAFFSAIYFCYHYVFEEGIFRLMDSTYLKSIDMTKNLVRFFFYAGFLGISGLLYTRILVMRMHDMNLSGWWGLLILYLPLLLDFALIMTPLTLNRSAYYILISAILIASMTIRLFPILMPGTKGVNNYGSPVKTGHYAGAIIAILLAILGCYLLYRYVTLQTLSLYYWEF